MIVISVPSLRPLEVRKADVLRKASWAPGDSGAQTMLVGAFARAEWDTVSPLRDSWTTDRRLHLWLEHAEIFLSAGSLASALVKSELCYALGYDCGGGWWR